MTVTAYFVPIGDAVFVLHLEKSSMGLWPSRSGG